MTAADLEAGKDFGRYLDVDGDGIPYRTYPGTHPTKGAYFTRGTTQGPLRALHRGRARLRRQHAAAAAQVRDREDAGAAAGADARPRKPTRFGVHLLRLDQRRRWTRRSTRSPREGIHLDALRVRAFPFPDEVADFIAAHDQVFVVEQNRDAQLRTLLVNEREHRPGAR